MPSDIKAILFDYGMVLTTGPDPIAWLRMQELTGFGHATLQAAYWAPRHAYDRGDLTGRQYWRQVAGPTLPESAIDQLIAADTALWTQPNQPMIDWAIALQRAGIRTGILSNIGDEMMHGVLATFPWLSGFHHRIWSHSLNLAKPEPAIYDHAAAGLETPPENILFLDDRADNIAAATQAGMQTLLYSTHADFEQRMRDRGLANLLAPAPGMG
jgi:putative hydrolase of the HAD superfamily